MFTSEPPKKLFVVGFLLKKNLKRHEACPETEESLIEAFNFPIHVWRPRKAKKTDLMPTLIMFHGGGWMMGDIDVHRRFYSNIAAHLNMVVVSPGYGSIFRKVDRVP